MIGFDLRDRTQKDLGLIYSSWMNIYRDGGKVHPAINQRLHHDHHAVVEELLETGECRVLCSAQDPDLIVGFAVFSGDCLHWVGVKKVYWRMSAARMLLAGLPLARCSHMTDRGSRLLHKFGELRYDESVLEHLQTKRTRGAHGKAEVR